MLLKCASDGLVTFYTMLHLTTKNETKYMMVKIKPGAQVNTICLGGYQKLFNHKVIKACTPRQGTLCTTSHSQISHDGKPQPFLGQFITDVWQISQPRSYHTYVYMLEDMMNPHILLSYTASECLGILEFKVPTEATQSHIDVVTLPSPTTPGSLRKTAKTVTLKEPL